MELTPRSEAATTHRWLDALARGLRAAPLPDATRRSVWRRLTRGRAGQPYFYPVRWRDVAGVHGGVCGVSDYMLLTPLASYEPECAPVVERLIAGQPRPVVLDVGCNTGAWVYLFKAINPRAIVHAFEPFPALAAFVRELAARNRWTDVSVEHAIVGAHAGEGTLHFAPGASDLASTVADFQSSYRATLSVPRLALDDFVASRGLSEIALIKIDVEGGELEVLQGARRTIEQLRPPLLLELLYTTTPSHQSRQMEVVATLKRAGYTFFLIRPDGALDRQDDVRPDPAYRALNYLVTATRSDSSPTLTA